MGQRRAATRLYGREREIELVADLISRASSGGSSLVVRGEAGIGKSSLLAEAAAHARQRGMLVLSTAGAQSETNLPFAALQHLLRPILEGIGRLEPMQRSALSSAFGLIDPVAPNPFMIGLAVLELIADVATRSPVLVVIDEAQWLDPSSADALVFVARRVEAEPIVVTFAIRDGLRNPLDVTGLNELHLEGIDTASAEALLDANTPGLSPRTRSRVLAYAAGNPLALIELPAVVGHERANTAVPLHLNERLERAFGQQVSGLGPPISTLLLVAAIDPNGTVSEITQAAGLIVGEDPSVDELRPAEAGRLIVIEDQHVRFRHPLLSSAVYQAASQSERRQAHRALAQLLSQDPERRAWHGAAATIGPDESCAQDLLAAAANAQRRGATAVAQSALEAAARLSEDPRLRGQRLVQAARFAFDIGNWQALAQRLTETVNPLDLDPGHRALLAWFLEVGGTSWPGADRMSSIIGAADAAVASGESQFALQLYAEIAIRYWWSNPDSETRASVVASLDRLEVSTDDPDLIAALALVAPVERGAELLERIRRLSMVPQTDLYQAHTLATAAHALGAFDYSTRIYGTAMGTGRQEARPGILARALVDMAWAAVHLGNVAGGLPIAHEAYGLALETSQHRYAQAARLAEATLAGLRGDFDRALSLAVEAESVLLRSGANPLLALVELARGQSALLRGDHSKAYAHLKRISDPNDTAYHMYVRFWGIGDLVEAAIQSGHEQEARDAIVTLEPIAAQSRSPVLEIGLRFARALVADEGEADALFQAAISENARLPLMAARSQLAYGLWLRRQRRIAESRPPLRSARDAFQAMGATPLAERARRELRASGENSPRRLPRVSDRLTPQEFQIAQMAAAGMSNREIGQSLFLSHRTVGFHLHRLFPKLGITSRTQLRGAIEFEELSA
jgi:DNA-binding CsgD family transcriptional regulator